MRNFQDFLTELGNRESSGNYSTVNNLGFTGKYQFGEAILIETGYYQAPSYYNGGENGINRCYWNGSWTNKARQYGVSTYEQFRDNVGNIQEAAIQDEFQFNMNKIIELVGRSGYTLTELLENSRYTHSGILAAAHLQGAWGAADLLTRGIDRQDEHGTRMTEYARIFSDYQVSPDNIGGVQFMGRGISDHIEESYWYEYSNKAMDNILKIRLGSAKIDGVKVFTPNYKWIDTEATANKLAGDIITDMHTQEKVLIPINLYGNHWVGLAIDKNENKIKIDYMDSEQVEIPILLKGKLMETLQQVYPDHEIELITEKVEVQKYNNCGPEVIENFAKYLTGTRLKQEDVPYVHSVLLEDNLIQEEIVGLTGLSDLSL